ncbi:allene oxide cyclase barrel-like domain-containing protein [Tengunoibacter tsumagoiensis]|uniref:Allene oxide cyclase n=1 Tax=Tengunoibacter tsumagoiensis TaxID=2014871 RepID=A0A401ZUK1_9CHLR|nr:hypothetical protein [Tengunoibacter tsumagoiensis]GCE10628.1 hypothetical protein KTT_04870 [Tengunoibacter tsumagoiensis]
MRKFIMAAAFIVSGLAFLGGAAQLAHVNASSNKDLHVYEHAAGDVLVVVGKNKNAVGNYNVFSSPVYDSKDSKRVGTVNGECLYTSSSDELCTFAVDLSDGQLIVEGRTAGSGNTTIYAVTGGTKAFKGASGDVTVVADKKHKEYEYFFHLN